VTAGPDRLTIGRYQIESELGRGGNGIVYRAKDPTLARIIALKVLIASGSQSPRQLIAEARAAAGLNHPHICTIYEAGELTGGDARGYIAMEYIEGVPLSVRLGPGPLPFADTFAIVTQVAEALAHAHSRGIVHGDLKPANVIVADSGVKLLDFGLARRVSLDDDGGGQMDTETKPVQVAGTVPYMAPELFRGHACDGRSDVWALGVLAFEMVAGRRPFGQTTSMATASEILERPVPSLPDDVPASFRNIVVRCLSKDKRRRCQTGGELAAAFSTIAVDTPSAAMVSVPRAGTKPRRHRRRIQSIAVLPLANHSADSGRQHVVDGMTETLITMLSRIDALRVVSRTSVMRYLGSTKTLQEIATELGVDGLVEGSAILDGQRLRVTARLIHAATDAHVWSETYDRELRDILSLQSGLARAIVDGIEIRLSTRDRAHLAEPAPVDPAVYDAYLRGRYHWNRRTAEDLRKSVAAYRDAIARDPTYAPAYVGIAECHLTGVSYSLAAPHIAMAEMKAMVVKALALDNMLPGAHMACAMVNYVYDWDLVAAERSLLRSLALNDRIGVAHMWYGMLLVTLRRVDEALRALARARELEPLSPGIGALSAMTLMYARRREEALTRCNEILELDPNFFLGLFIKALTLESLREYKLAASTLEHAMRVTGGDPVGGATLARFNARLGETAVARSLLDEQIERRLTRYQSAHAIASVYLALGDHDTAMTWLEKGLEERAFHMIFLGLDENFDPLRGDPRFIALLRRIGVQANIDLST
jgi:serine/threonine protein kinase/tetratricopeptide (TPR) repeat protein